MAQDAGELRGAPLGWGFPLAFLIHGLMPLGAIAAVVAVKNDLGRVAIVASAVLVSAAIVLFLVRSALRARARVERFRRLAHAPHFDARLTEVVDLGSAGRVKRGGRSTSYAKAWTRVLVEPRGQPPFELAGEACYTRAETRGLVPGARFSVAFDPRAPDAFMIVPGTIPAPPSAVMAGPPPAGMQLV